MKKFNASVLAIAALAMSMTACNKEEITNGSVFVSVEENEITNSTKLFLAENDSLYWDENDNVTLYDADGNSAIYAANTNVYPTEFEYIQDVNTQRRFDHTKAPLYAYFPRKTATSAGVRGVIALPYVQTSNNGELAEFPMYGEGTFNNFTFRNVCGVIRMRLSGDVTLDSITITTDKKVNGRFDIDFTNFEHMISADVRDNSGTKTAVLKTNAPIALGNGVKEVNMYLPAETYRVFNITFFANGKAYTMRNKSNITIYRTQYTVLDKTLNTNDFEDFVYGSTNARFSLGNNTFAYIAKGNLQFLGYNYRVWHIADNGFDVISNDQVYWNLNTDDRDLFAWGATGHKLVSGTNAGNEEYIYPKSSKYRAYTGTVLSNLNEWGSFGIMNLDQTSPWSTPTKAQVDAILENNTPFMATVMGVNGLVILPAGINLAENTNMDKEEWNTYEAAGAAFLPIVNYRHNNADNNYHPSAGAIYWTAEADETNANNAMALTFGLDNATSMNKLHGGFVRLISVVE